MQKTKKINFYPSPTLSNRSYFNKIDIIKRVGERIKFRRKLRMHYNVVGISFEDGCYYADLEVDEKIYKLPITQDQADILKINTLIGIQVFRLNMG
jgi:hypothetical protein